MGTGIMDILGLKGGSSNQTSFITAAKNNKLGMSKDPSRRIRKANFAGVIRKNLNMISANGVKEKFEDGSVKSVKIKKNTLAEIIKNSNIIGMTEREAETFLEKKRGFSSVDKGKKVFYSMTGNKEMANTRKFIGQALVEKRKELGLTDAEKRRNKKLGDITSRMAGGMKEENWQAEIENKRKEPLRGLKKDSSGIDAAQVDYSISAKSKAVSTGDFREKKDNDPVNYNSGNNNAFASRVGQENKTVGVAGKGNYQTTGSQIIQMFGKYKI